MEQSVVSIPLKSNIKGLAFMHFQLKPRYFQDDAFPSSIGMSYSIFLNEVLKIHCLFYEWNTENTTHIHLSLSCSLSFLKPYSSEPRSKEWQSCCSAWSYKFPGLRHEMSVYINTWSLKQCRDRFVSISHPVQGMQLWISSSTLCLDSQSYVYRI